MTATIKRIQNYTRDSMPASADDEEPGEVAKALADGFESLNTVADANEESGKKIAKAIADSGDGITDALQRVAIALEQIAKALNNR